MIAVETATIGRRGPIFAKRMSDNRSALAAATSRVDTLETQVARGPRRIKADTVAKFGSRLSEKLRGDYPTLRTAYPPKLVSDVTVPRKAILISSPQAAP